MSARTEPRGISGNCYPYRNRHRARQRREPESSPTFVKRIRIIASEHLIFLDESGVTISMKRLSARSLGGRRIDEATPGSHWKIMTILGAIAEHVLCPALHPGDMVVMDNLSSHKVQGIQQRIEKCGAEVRYLPPYSPYLIPIEKAWSKLKQLLRSTKARSIEMLEGFGGLSVPVGQRAIRFETALIADRERLPYCIGGMGSPPLNKVHVRWIWALYNTETPTPYHVAGKIHERT